MKSSKKSPKRGWVGHFGCAAAVLARAGVTVAVLVVFAVIAAVAVPRYSGERSTTTANPPANTPAGANGCGPGNGLPMLFVQPFTVTGTAGPDSISATSLYGRLTSAFSNSTWSISAGSSRTPPLGRGRTASRPVSQPHIDYRLSGLSNTTTADSPFAVPARGYRAAIGHMDPGVRARQGRRRTARSLKIPWCANWPKHWCSRSASSTATAVTRA